MVMIDYPKKKRSKAMPRATPIQRTGLVRVPSITLTAAFEPTAPRSSTSAGGEGAKVAASGLGR